MELINCCRKVIRHLSWVRTTVIIQYLPLKEYPVVKLQEQKGFINRSLVFLHYRILKNIGMQQVGRNYYHVTSPIMIEKFK